MGQRFACDGCGACCRRAGEIPGFPEPTDASGRCVHLQADNRCAIYDRRPAICNVDGFYDAQLQPVITRERWHALIHAGCRELQRAEQRA